MNFPQRAFIQGFEGSDKLSYENQLVYDELCSRSIPVTIYSTEYIICNPLPLLSTDLVVGDFHWTRSALKQLNIPFPQPPDYPDCLKHLLHRQIWISTLGEVQKLLFSKKNEGDDSQELFFIKPANDTKAFCGLIATLDWLVYLLEELPSTFPVLCSELVEFVSEYRVYVVNGTIRCICHYKGSKEDRHALDMNIVEEAVRLLTSSHEGKQLTGCGIDFGIMKVVKDNGDEIFVTSLVEVNDGYSLGAYKSLQGNDYTDLLIARWQSLINNSSA